MKNELEFLKEMSEVNGISGFEHLAIKTFKKYVEDSADKVEFDNLGSIIAYKKGEQGEPKVLLTGHIDEVGFLVEKIEESGLIRMRPIGGWWSHIVPAELMTVTTSTGKEIIGVTGAQPPHGMTIEQRKQVVDIKDQYLDLGVKNKTQVEELGIKIGDPITPKTDFRIMNDGKTLLGKAWDDRIGAAVCIAVMNNLKNEKIKANLAVAGTVQEEVGLRGAKTVSYHVKPDIAIAVDVTMSYDLPKSPKYDTKLGNGVALSICDASFISHRGLFDFVEKIAKENNIRYTYDMLSAGGTDSGEMHKQFDGIINMTISLPCRYFHSPTLLINLDDYHEAVNLLTDVVRNINKEVLQDLKESKYR